MIVEIVVLLFAALVALRLYIKSKWFYVTEEIDLSGKTIVVTGANSGIGKNLAVELARRNARVILACRNVLRGEEARKHICSASGRHDGGIVFKQLDLSSLDSVRNFVRDIEESEARLDVLVNNAGISGYPAKSTADGLEFTYQTNYFGPFLLTNLLLGLLKKSGPGSRIVNVASFIHTSSDLNLDYLEPTRAKAYQTRKFFCKRARVALYYNSKLMNVMFTFELSRRLKDTGITVNCVCPGIVRTKFITEWSIPALLMRPITELLAKTTKAGCQPVLHCAVSKSLKNITGRYFRNGQENTEIHKMARDRDACKRLWEASEKFTGLNRL